MKIEGTERYVRQEGEKIQERQEERQEDKGKEREKKGNRKKRRREGQDYVKEEKDKRMKGIGSRWKEWQEKKNGKNCIKETVEK